MFTSCNGDEADELDTDNFYDVIQINGESYASYGYRCPITYASDWDLEDHSGTVRVVCGKLSDAQKGEYDYDYAYAFYLSGNKDLKKGSKLEDFEIDFYGDAGEFENYRYSSGSATIVDKKDDQYITVKFSSFKFTSRNKSYVFDGNVQLALDED